MTRGKLEALITVPAGGWDLSVAETGGGTSTVTLPAGDYYLSSGRISSEDSLCDALAAALNDDATLVGSYAVTVSAGESGTGQVTIAESGGTVTALALTWDDTDLRDLLGFSGDETGTLSFTGEYHARSLWLPDCVPQMLNSQPWPGVYETDLHTAESASGHAYVASGQVKVALTDIRWPAVSQARTWKYSETLQGQSFERFWLDSIIGRASWAQPGGPVRYYWDADDAAKYWTYRAMGPASFRPDQVRQNWAGRFAVALPRLVLLPEEVDKDPAGDPPVAAATPSVEDTSVTWVDGSTDADGTIVAWSLDPGDGSEPLAGPGPWVHDYGVADTFTWTLTVTDSSGLTDEVSDSVTTFARDTIEVTRLTSGNSGTDGTSIATESVEPAGDAAVYACIVAGRDAGHTVEPTCSGNGLSWQKVGSVVDGGLGRVQVTVFRAMGSDPSAGAITFDFGAETQESFIWHVVQCAGVDTGGSDASDATVQAVTTQADTEATITGTLAALEDASNVHLAFCAGRGAITWTPDADFAELSDHAQASSHIGSASMWAAGEVECTATPSTAAGTCMVSIEVKSGVAA